MFKGYLRIYVGEAFVLWRETLEKKWLSNDSELAVHLLQMQSNCTCVQSVHVQQDVNNVENMEDVETQFEKSDVSLDLDM